MGKTVDKILFALFGATFIFLLFYTTMRSVLAGTIASILFIGILFFARLLIRPRVKRDCLSKRDFIRYVLLNGNAALQKLVENALSENHSFCETDGCTLLSYEKNKVLVTYAYKFGALSEEDVAKSYRIARKNDADEIYALTYRTDRKALAITEYIPQKYTIVSASTVYKYLSKRGLIPKKGTFKREKVRIKNLLRLAFDGRNLKYYVLGGLAMTLLSVVTPLRTYYIIFAVINLLFAVLSALIGGASSGACDLFKE